LVSNSSGEDYPTDSGLIKTYREFTSPPKPANPFDSPVVPPSNHYIYQEIIYDLEKGLTLSGTQESLLDKLLEKYRRKASTLETEVARDSLQTFKFSFFEILKNGPFAEKPTFLNQMIRENTEKLNIYKKFISDIQSEL
jgi:hypothetical protein